jgi:hypothetical protein
MVNELPPNSLALALFGLKKVYSTATSFQNAYPAGAGQPNYLGVQHAALMDTMLQTLFENVMEKGGFFNTPNP